MTRLFSASVAIAVVLGVVLAAEPPKFPEPYDSEKSLLKPQSAEDAARGFKVPPGFRVEVFASEPDVRNPIACCWDTKGRFWVAENYTYAESQKKFDLSLRDRVIIFHDKDGDGKPDERKVFIDTVQRLTSVEVGLGGVWLMCPPQLLFVPDRNGDDIPDGPPEVVLEGFDVPAQNYHNFANGLKWGPDGWLYGRCGASAPGEVRRPDQGPQDAVPLRGGIWRYHPHRKVFEALCHGTTNPWGHDWDAYGELFFINTVGGHLWHMIPGAHYSRSHTIDPNPLVYEPMEMIADHWHFDTGKGWSDSRKVDPTVDKLGGGQAHVGCLIYNGDQWPKEYRGKLLTLNQHGRRINVERIERKGSGYVGKHEPDMFFASDPFFRGIELSQGPDGSVYVLDWSDTGECHEHNGVHRSSGRIYRIIYGNPNPWTMPDLTKATVAELALLQSRDNEWYIRQSRRELINRSAGKFDPGKIATNALVKMLDTDNQRARNNALQLLSYYGLFYFYGGEKGDYLLRDNDEHIRRIIVRGKRWGLQDTVTGDDKGNTTKIDDQTKRFYYVGDLFALEKTAKDQTSSRIRLELASTLQALPIEHRIDLGTLLASYSADADDANIPHMIWYGLIPIAIQTPELLIDVAATAKIPHIRKWTARRFAEVVAEKPDCINALLLKTSGKDELVRRDVIQGMTEGLAGIRKATPPGAWKTYPKTFADKKLNDQVLAIDVVFGDGRALDEVKKLAFDGKAAIETRKAALRSLIDANLPDLREVCEKLLKVRFLNVVALKGLAKFDDAGPMIIQHWNAFHPSERPLVIDALASRPSFAASLLEEIGKGRIPRADLSAGQARTIRGFGTPGLTAKLAEVWGEYRESPKDKADLIAKLKGDLTADALRSADASAGRAIFAKTCASCHKLYGEGQNVGPDLTGAGRKDMDYLLSNIIDPSAVVTKDFQMTRFTLKDGRVLNGIVTATAPKTATIQMEKEKLTVAADDIESRTQSVLSLMPDGLLQTLSPAEIRDLFAYLQSTQQVPLK